jgi:ADP-ribose diphosphatase
LDTPGPSADPLDVKVDARGSGRDATVKGVQPWTVVGSELVADCRVFQVTRSLSLNPVDRQQHDFFVIGATDWTNVIPLTQDGYVVMIEQYRHGSAEITLEFPGGMVDPGESPAATAARELLEETGFHAPQVVSLGRLRPNPAILNNWLHLFVAPDVFPGQQPQNDAVEQTSVRLVPLAAVPSLIDEGVINHALAVAGFCRFFLSRSLLGTKE